MKIGYAVFAYRNSLNVYLTLRPLKKFIYLIFPNKISKNFYYYLNKIFLILYYNILKL